MTPSRLLRVARTWRRAARVCVLLGALAAAEAALALDPARALTQYVQDVYTQREGLPMDTVNAILQTRDGYLWLGTEEGLVRFDGARFVVFDRRTRPEMPSSFVMALCEDREGALWVGTYGGGLLRFSGGRIEVFTTKEGLPSDRIRSVVESRDGSLWIATSGGGLVRRSGGRFQTWTTKEGLPSDRVWTVLEEPDGGLLVATYGGGLARFRDGRFSRVALDGSAGAEQVRPLCRDADGSVWIGTDGAGLFRLRDGIAERVSSPEGLPGAMVRALRIDRQGSLWIGTEGGGLIRRLPNGRFTALTPREGLTSGSVFALAEDREGSLWVGTSAGGLNRFRDGRFLTITTREGLPNDVIRAVLEDRNGDVWVGSSGGGLARLRDGVVSRVEGLTSDQVFAIHEGRDGRLWVGTDGAGVFVVGPDGRALPVTGEGEPPGERIRTLCEDRDGGLWIGTTAGLSRLSAGRYRSYGPAEGMPAVAVRAVVEGRDGTIWVGTDGEGLHRVATSGLTSLTTRDGLPSDRVFSLYEDREGTLWIGTSGGGLGRLSAGRLASITSRDGLFDDVVFQVLEDADETLWMTCNRGVFRVGKADLSRRIAGEVTRVTSVAYGTADGMRTAECNGGWPAGFRTRDGRLLIPTQRGLVVISPRELSMNRQAPSVLVEEVVAEGRAHTAAGAPLRLAPGTRQLELRYTALSLRVPSRVRFRYRLEGLDPDWIDAGTRRVAFYTHLPPGRFRFRVSACNDDGVWNVEGATLDVTQLPRFFQTPWFLAGCVLVAIGGALAGHRVRVARLKRRERELERLVSERTEQLRERTEELSKAQEQIEGFAKGDALEDPARWAQIVSREIARSVGASGIHLFLFSEGTLSPLEAGGPAAPDASRLDAALARGGFQEKDGQVLVPVLGLTGERRGALVVEGVARWGDVSRRLVVSLARHLGTALDLLALRERLDTSEAALSSGRLDLRRRGMRLAAVCPRCGSVADDEEERCPADGFTLESARLLPLLVGGRWRLRRRLGEGGMGVVFLARDEKLSRDVAVKIVLPELLRDAGVKLRFEREARLVAQIRHPGVVALYDTGELPDGSAFLVMEHLLGQDLERMLAEFGPGTPRQVARLLEQAGEALSAAHAAGILHRDVKPANVFLVPEGDGFQVRLVDFGMARPLHAEGHLTQTGTIVGTPAYMSPEQIEHRPVDARSDLYSLAAVAFEALTGRPVVADGELARVFLDVLQTVPRALSASLPGAGPELDAAFAAALGKKAENRPSDLARWARETAALLEALPEGVGAARGWTCVAAG